MPKGSAPICGKIILLIEITAYFHFGMEPAHAWQVRDNRELRLPVPEVHLQAQFGIGPKTYNVEEQKNDINPYEETFA